jgi:hypothetical protein
MSSTSVNGSVNRYAWPVPRSSAKARRPRGHIRRRGESFQVLVYAVQTYPLLERAGYDMRWAQRQPGAGDPKWVRVFAPLLAA